MFKNFLENINNNPVMLAGIIQAIVPVLVVFQIVHWSEAQTAVLYTAITAVLTTFVRGNTVAKPQVEQRIEEKVAHRELAGTTGTGIGMTPSATPGPATPGIGNFVILLAAMTGIIFLVSCGPKVPPTTSPEGKVAVHATRIVDGLRGVLPMIKPLVCQPSTALTQLKVCLKPEDAIKVAYAVEQAADAAITLGPILSAIDNSPSVDERVTGVAKARAILEKIQNILMNVAVTPDAEPARQELVKLFSTVTTLLFAVQF